MIFESLRICFKKIIYDLLCAYFRVLCMCGDYNALCFNLECRTITSYEIL
jgi:hypothetical protein